MNLFEQLGLSGACGICMAGSKSNVRNEQVGTPVVVEATMMQSPDGFPDSLGAEAVKVLAGHVASARKFGNADLKSSNSESKDLGINLGRPVERSKVQGRMSVYYVGSLSHVDGHFDGEGLALTGHHEIFAPLLACAIKLEAPRSSAGVSD